MEEVIRIDSVDDYNKLFGLPTIHPLVSVVDLSESHEFPNDFSMSYGVYALYLKQTKCGDIRYGRNRYDYQEGTVVAFAPGQVSAVERTPGMMPSAYGVLFHPDLIRGTSLGREIGNYTFFSYDSTEALHLSEEERVIVKDCLDKIRRELEQPADSHTQRLIVSHIRLLLDYCMRFYERQFVTRTEVNRDVLVAFERLLNGYYESGEQHRNGLPSVKYFADKVCLSANYFGDLIKKETGRSAQEQIQNKLIDLAKERILSGRETIGEIAYDLGFQYAQHFSRLFKRVTGLTPNQYRLRAD